ncbi:MAG TPA: hypothetical protein PLO61_01405 [Fimbriimonadaceae bacterium]|nr:hypothetical protein [Fimbriimonadaceae bacterium]HRJ32185.1 hypothetical protein [Fimbriimonadaceae bacterium]
MMKRWVVLMLLSWTLILAGCGGAGGDDPTPRSPFEGIWEVQTETTRSRVRGNFQDTLRLGIGQTGTLTGSIQRVNLGTGRVSRATIRGGVSSSGLLRTQITGSGEIESAPMNGQMALTSSTTIELVLDENPTLTSGTPLTMNRVE